MSGKSSPALTEQPAEPLLRDGDIHQRPLKGLFTIAELAVRLRFTESAPGNPEASCREWLQREGIMSLRRGRVILVDGVDVDRKLRGR